MKKILYLFFLIPVCMISTFTLISICSQEEPLFSVRNLKINGVQQLNEREIISKIGPFITDSIFRVDIEKIRQNIISHPFVKDVRIKRLYPFSIVIEVMEKKPSALWTDSEGTIMMLDEEGEPYRTFTMQDNKGLVIISAKEKKDAKTVFKELNQWIAEGLIKREEISQVVYREGDVVVFGINDNVEIILGRDALKARLKRAMAVLEDAKKKGIMIKCIDARFEKGAIIEERKG